MRAHDQKRLFRQAQVLYLFHILSNTYKHLTITGTQSATLSYPITLILLLTGYNLAFQTIIALFDLT